MSYITTKEFGKLTYLQKYPDKFDTVSSKPLVQSPEQIRSSPKSNTPPPSFIFQPQVSSDACRAEQEIRFVFPPKLVMQTRPKRNLLILWYYYVDF